MSNEIVVFVCLFLFYFILYYVNFLCYLFSYHILRGIQVIDRADKACT